MFIGQVKIKETGPVERTQFVIISRTEKNAPHRWWANVAVYSNEEDAIARAESLVADGRGELETCELKVVDIWFGRTVAHWIVEPKPALRRIK